MIWGMETGTITYDSTSTDGSTISPSTGQYTASTSTQGLYTISFSAYTRGQTWIYLYKDGVQQEDTVYVNECDSYSYGQGSRSLVMCLKQGQEVHLKPKYNNAGIQHLQFCVTLESEAA